VLKLLWIFCAGAAWLSATGAFAQQQLAPPPVATPQAAQPRVAKAQPVDQQKAIVYAATAPGAMEDYTPVDPATERQMVDRLVLAITGQTDLGKAWQMLVRPDDYIGIKVSTVGGRLFSTHWGIVAAIAAGLQQAGIPLALE
jgi:hypothetical protein